jgi:hypothetical protein
MLLGFMCEEFAMPQCTFWQRAAYQWPCVALASILADDICQEEGHISSLSLREEASRDRLTYLQIIKFLPNADLYLARVASDPEKLAESDLLAFFTEDQLLYTVPFDVRSQTKRPDQVIAMINAHAAALKSPSVRTKEDRQERIQAPEPDFTERTLHPLAETIELTRDELQDALQITVDQQDESPAGVSPNRATQILQQALLLAAIEQLMGQLRHTPSLIAQARCRLLVRLRHWQRATQQKVVNARARWSPALGQMWEVRIGVPLPRG